MFSSTCATYGEPQQIPIDETHPQLPTNPYGWSKLFVERILTDYDRAYKLRFVALRYFNASGASPERGERHDPEPHLIPLVLKAAKKEIDHVTVFGNDYPTIDGTCVRDYIHVSDLAEAHALALDYLRNGGSSTAINLGNGQGYSVLEVIQAARDVTGQDIPMRSRDDVRAIHRTSSLTPQKPGQFSAGNHSTRIWRQSSVPPGTGMQRTSYDKHKGNEFHSKSAKGAEYESQGQARSASPLVSYRKVRLGLKGRNKCCRITPFQG